MNLHFKIPKFSDKREKLLVAAFLASALVFAFCAGVGRDIYNYADIKFFGIRFLLIEGSLICFWAICFLGYERPPRRFWVYAGALAALAVFAFLPPIASGDSITSIFRIKIISLTHTNPYLIAPSQFPGDPWISGTSWRHIPMPYGPLWVILSLVFLPFVKLGFGTALFFYKAALGVAAIASGALIGRIAEKLGADGRKAEFIFLWNPLVLLVVFSDAHNDILMILLLLLAILFLLEEKYETAIVLLAASALIKYVTLLALPFFVLHFYRKTKSPAKIFSGILLAAVLSGSVFYIFWAGTYTFRGLLLASAIVSPNSLIVHTANIFGLGLGFFVKYKEFILAAGAALIAAVFCWSARAEGRIIKGIFWSFAALLAVTTDLYNWYLLWPLALAPLMEERRRPYYAAAAVSLFGILHINRPFWETFIYAALFFAAAILIDYGPRRAAELCRNRIFGRA